MRKTTKLFLGFTAGLLLLLQLRCVLRLLLADVRV